MVMYLDANGFPYGGDRQMRPDGTLDPIAPDRPSPAHQWLDGAWVIPVSVDWDAFRIAMMGDSAYQKMAIGVMGSNQGNWLLTTLQDAITMPVPSIARVRPLWNQIIQLILMKPTPADVARWQDYADSSGVGIKFQSNGAIS